MTDLNHGQPGWYKKLMEYFPQHEMKHRGQLEALIKDKECYIKEETDDYVLLYAEFPEFVFVDYLLVTSYKRRKGIGSGVIKSLKQKGKLIILETELEDPNDPDTQKRKQFYMKHEFNVADQIQYIRTDKNGNSFRLHILYWAPENETQQTVYEKMRKTCEEIHNFSYKKYYGKPLADPDQSLLFQ